MKVFSLEERIFTSFLKLNLLYNKLRNVNSKQSEVNEAFIVEKKRNK